MSHFTMTEINKALKEVQRQLLAGEIEAKEFDMSVPIKTTCSTAKNGCGTAGCIGGHAAIVLGLEDYDRNTFVAEADLDWDEPRGILSNKQAKALNALFYPHVTKVDDWAELTPVQAVVALDRYFAGSKNPWKGIA